jgi:hypothetical protein
MDESSSDSGCRGLERGNQRQGRSWVSFRLVLFCAGCLAWSLDAILIFNFNSRVCFNLGEEYIGVFSSGSDAQNRSSV